MTLVAVNAVVDVPADTLMLLVGVRLGVAVGAGKYSVIVGIGVTRGAHAVRIPMVHREVSMIPVRRDPCGCVMAGGAGRGESRRGVVWIGRASVVSLVTRVAGRRQRRVVVVDVTTGARNGHVGSRQWERCVVVIEARRDPGRRVVAHIALLWETCSDVVRAGRALEILQVAAHTCRARQMVVVVDVAGGARRTRMRSCQRETGSGVIERRRLPCACAMANLASLRESLRRMVGISGVLIVLQVARHAGFDRQVEVPAGMALIALQRRMRPS